MDDIQRQRLVIKAHTTSKDPIHGDQRIRQHHRFLFYPVGGGYRNSAILWNFCEIFVEKTLALGRRPW
jgi:hypothetical protein